jgi:hypothetical protein
MRRYVAFIITGIVLLTSVILSANFELKSDAIAQTQNNATVIEPVYVLKQSKGHLAVFKNGENEPIITTDTLISDLPYDDQNKLLTGIKVTGDQNLRIALEDYCS